MITASDSFSTVDLGDYYAILPSDGRLLERFLSEGSSFSVVASGFAYNSGTNPDFLTVVQLRKLIREHVDPQFQPV
jgi:UDP-N-acetylglucosamine 4,6-dehydratase